MFLFFLMLPKSPYFPNTLEFSGNESLSRRALGRRGCSSVPPEQLQAKDHCPQGPADLQGPTRSQKGTGSLLGLWGLDPTSLCSPHQSWSQCKLVILPGHSSDPAGSPHSHSSGCARGFVWESETQALLQPSPCLFYFSEFASLCWSQVQQQQNGFIVVVEPRGRRLELESVGGAGVARS